MKRLFAIILCVFLVFGLFACGETQAPVEETTPATNSPTTLKSIKVLAIGNSFSVDAMEYLYAVAKAEGVQEIILGNLFVGGCTLQMHANYMENDAPEYRYYKNTTGTWQQTEGYTLKQGLQDEQWDIITMQQGSRASGFADTYQPYLDKLIEYVNANKTNPEAKIAWHMTWAYQGNSTHKAFPNYGSSQKMMYLCILDVLKKVIDVNENISMTIPAGTAIQYGRKSFGDVLTRDGYHLNDLGRLIAAYTWYAALDGQELRTVNVDRVGLVTLSDEDKTAIAEAVRCAISNPQSTTVVD